MGTCFLMWIQRWLDWSTCNKSYRSNSGSVIPQLLLHTHAGKFDRKHLKVLAFKNKVACHLAHTEGDIVTIYVPIDESGFNFAPPQISGHNSVFVQCNHFLLQKCTFHFLSVDLYKKSIKKKYLNKDGQTVTFDATVLFGAVKDTNEENIRELLFISCRCLVTSCLWLILLPIEIGCLASFNSILVHLQFYSKNHLSFMIPFSQCQWLDREER